jgi:hypothetical protein
MQLLASLAPGLLSRRSAPGSSPRPAGNPPILPAQRAPFARRKQRIAIACRRRHPRHAMAGPAGSRGSAAMTRASWVREVTPAFRNTLRR